MAFDQSLGIAVDATSVYWTDQSGPIMKVPVGGGSPVTVANGFTPYVIAVDSTSIYWSESGTLKKVAIDGGTPITLAQNNMASIWGIAVGSTGVYWTEGSNGSVMKIAVDGGTPETLASGLSGGAFLATGIAVDSKSVYWVEEPSNLMACSCSVMKLTPN
jgi:hypothetical protein